MANLAERKLVPGPNGPALRSQVTCAAWSTKGKQLVAGMGDGSVYQMTPDGAEKGHIPKPPSLGDYHGESLRLLLLEAPTTDLTSFVDHMAREPCIPNSTQPHQRVRVRLSHHHSTATTGWCTANIHLPETHRSRGTVRI